MADHATTAPDSTTLHPRARPDAPDTRAAQLREALVDGLRPNGKTPTARVAQAMRHVPRHVFTPDVPLKQAYADDSIRTKVDDSGATISCASQPTIIAMMLDQLGVAPGHRILEIGAATGYNAALLAHLAGPTGHVTTIDIDDDLVESARRGLYAAAVETVTVVHGDGALGHLPGAPYDRIVATVGAWDIPTAWLDQLTPHGRLVVPARIRGDVSRSIAFERDPAGDGWRSVSSGMCGFVPLRGLADDRRNPVPLTDNDTVTVDVRQDQTADSAAIAAALRESPTTVWTGVRYERFDSPEWMWLYLSLILDGGLSRMTVQPTAIDSGLVDPQFSWGTMATITGESLAYLTMRKFDLAEPQWEVGVIAHGPTGMQLATRVAEATIEWNSRLRTRAAQFTLHRQPAVAAPAADEFVVNTPHHRMVISWANPIPA